MEIDNEDIKKENAKRFLKNIANNIIKAYQQRENEYFNLQLTIQDNFKYTDYVAKNLIKLPMEAQIEMLRVLANSAEVAKEICERYDIEVEE